MSSLGYDRSCVLVDARLLPDVKRYRDADSAADVSWRPRLPGVEPVIYLVG